MSASAPSLKLTTAAQAWACTLGALKSSMTAMRAGRILAWWEFCRSGPRSVHIWPSAWQAAQRTLGCGSCRPLTHMSTRGPSCLLITLAQPSAICAKQMRVACLFFQSASCRNWGSRVPAAGTMALPPKAMEMRSRFSCPASYKSPLPASSCWSLSALCHRGSSSTSSRNSMQVSNRLPAKLGSLRIMPGALSRASHRVTRNSAAMVRVAASRLSARVTLIMALTTWSRLLRRKRGWYSATSMNISSASCAAASSPEFKVLPRVASMGRIMCWNLSRSAGSSSTWIKADAAARAASCTSLFAWLRHWPSTCTSWSRWGRMPSIMKEARLPRMMRADSMWSGWGEWIIWNRKGSKSGQPFCSDTAAPSSATAWQTFFTTVFCVSSFRDARSSFCTSA
mmetsp:Transcript_32926/g.72731  ORF Transcript_32926/g.72731 Transcript_32926/m.72731 type:complete len:396 (-) Transcript_32926:463-1650(-)